MGKYLIGFCAVAFFVIALLMLVVDGDYPLAAPLLVVFLGIIALGDFVKELRR